MANTERVRDLDLFDRFPTRLHLYSQMENLSHLPASLAGDLQLPTNRRKPGKVARACTPTGVRPQKENQCPES